MEGLRTYILSVTAAGILCAVIGRLVGKGSYGSILKLMCGIVMTAVIIKPVMSVAPINLSRYLNQLDTDAAAVIDTGLQYSREATRDRISRELEAYILDKAGELGLHITVTLALNERELFPETATITGPASPHARSAITEILREDLGIPAESLIWK